VCGHDYLVGGCGALAGLKSQFCPAGRQKAFVGCEPPLNCQATSGPRPWRRHRTPRRHWGLSATVGSRFRTAKLVLRPQSRNPTTGTPPTKAKRPLKHTLKHPTSRHRTPSQPKLSPASPCRDAAYSLRPQPPPLTVHSQNYTNGAREGWQL